MTPSNNIIPLLEALRIPINSPSSSLDWKDWYHYILFDMTSCISILCNISLSGRPGYGHITCTGIVTIPQKPVFRDLCAGPYGFCVDYDWQDTMVVQHPVAILSTETTLLIDNKCCSVMLKNDRSSIEISFTGTANATPILVPETLPFGSGFIGWGFIPGMTVTGHVRLGSQKINIDPVNWFCYHDHNYGRFRWGEDIGWIWFIATFYEKNGQKLSFVLHRGNNRDLSCTGVPYLFIYINNEMRKIFTGASLNLEWTWENTAVRPIRLPGTMATLFSNRTVTMPSSLLVSGSDDADNVLLQLSVTDTIELILPDTQSRQYTFIEEINGKSEVKLTIDSHTHTAEGLFYAEYVY
jgi:hypothetical protein